MKKERVRGASAVRIRGGIRGKPRVVASAAERPEPATCAERTNRKSKFAHGDVVALVTGSFQMVVAGIEKGGMVSCVSCTRSGEWLTYNRLPEKGLKRMKPVALPRKADPNDIPF